VYPEISAIRRQAGSVVIGKSPGNRDPARYVTGSGMHPTSSKRVKRPPKEWL
jgi:hypothetical protein